MGSAVTDWLERHPQAFAAIFAKGLQASGGRAAGPKGGGGRGKACGMRQGWDGVQLWPGGRVMLPPDLWRGPACGPAAVQAAKAADAARKARELVRRKNVLTRSTLPGKLADCTSASKQDSEIFIVEVGPGTRLPAYLPACLPACLPGWLANVL